MKAAAFRTVRDFQKVCLGVTTGPLRGGVQRGQFAPGPRLVGGPKTQSKQIFYVKDIFHTIRENGNGGKGPISQILPRGSKFL